MHAVVPDKGNTKPSKLPVARKTRTVLLHVKENFFLQTLIIRIQRLLLALERVEIISNG